MTEKKRDGGIFFALYSLAWKAALPFAFFSRRLRKGFKQRLGRSLPRGPFDCWIQAASVGECKLAAKLIRSIPEDKKISIVVSTCTQQGMDTLGKELDKSGVRTVYFPFDLPRVMQKALKIMRPSAVIFLETEIWPALMRACRKKGIPVGIANARMSTRSYSRYLSINKRLKKIAPEAVVGISETDVRRYRDIFPDTRIRQAPNMKFDALGSEEPIPFIKNPLGKIFGPQPQLFVLASIREQEEMQVRKIALELLNRHPNSLIGLFPRHLHRIPAWKEFFSQKGITYRLRSEIKEKPSWGTVILWDRFGELNHAYALARSAYVGGSLVPCGGQNFLEALEQGLIPCIGPYWSNFGWAGKELIDQGLVREISGTEEALRCLEGLQPSSRESICYQFQRYLDSRRGGTAINRDMLLELIKNF